MKDSVGIDAYVPAPVVDTDLISDPRLTVNTASVIPPPVSLSVRAGAAPIVYPDPRLLIVKAVIAPADTVIDVRVAVTPLTLCSS